MFKKEDGIDEVETVIGPSVQVDGDFVAVGDVIVEGTVSGKIKTEKSLRVGEGAKIFASVSAGSALIAGEIQGNIKIKESLELTSSARIFGDVKAKILTMAPGAGLHGKTQVGEDKKSRTEKIEDKHQSKTKSAAKAIPVELIEKTK